MKKQFPSLIIMVLSLLNLQSLNSDNNTPEKRWTEQDRKYIVDELNRTTTELMMEIEELSAVQWNFTESPDRWSINEIVEHLEIQNELHFRQIIVVSNSPQLPQYISVVKNLDDHFSSYATVTAKRKAKWFLEPLGRFCSKEESIQAFRRVRNHLTEFVKNTKVDLRKHFSFSSYIKDKAFDEIKPGEVFDLHQLLLIGIAHTDRHLKQIRTIKEHTNYKRLK